VKEMCAKIGKSVKCAQKIINPNQISEGTSAIKCGIRAETMHYNKTNEIKGGIA
jgi:hypothetical protein